MFTYKPAHGAETCPFSISYIVTKKQKALLFTYEPAHGAETCPFSVSYVFTKKQKVLCRVCSRKQRVTKFLRANFSIDKNRLVLIASIRHFPTKVR
jgi:rubredoxin